ncbi:putative circularly permuted ATP-grasp superfamily protein [Bacillus horti]|uniref:Circularly permuted ATP-grasp superfamily protein n=2 Tax=Caldalkalibacillus horti TaxID=77523 RepID=A0ABT9W4A8_9BACI|nr:putative circularly permuted ATP-grasp superfamily protein [Bacillus horti]
MIKAWKTENDYRFVKVQGKPLIEKSINNLYHKVTDGRPIQSILVQKAIDLASINGRPFSIRLMLMRDGKREWQYAGMLAKVSGEDSIVTNVRRGGGYATTVDDALAKSLGYSSDQIKRKNEEIIRIGFEIIRHATDTGYRSHETGIDLGIDNNGKVWIIEVNLSYPSHALFNRLQDKTFYRKIKSLAAEYQET